MTLIVIPAGAQRRAGIWEESGCLCGCLRSPVKPGMTTTKKEVA